MLVDYAMWFVLVSGWAVLGYYLLVNGLYLLVQVAGLFHLRDDLRDLTWGPMFHPFDSPFMPGISILVPAYNEAPIIVDTVQALLQLNYPTTEVIVINDGSEDETLKRLVEAFHLEQIEAQLPYEIPSEPINRVYRSTQHEDLVVVDKENGGKSDALNAGLWLAEEPLTCSIDADSIIDSDGLLKVVKPFLRDPHETVATGGTVRVANGCEIEDGVVKSVGLPRNNLAEIQVIEYLRAFYSGRLGLDQLDSLILISGAFGLFRTDVIREIGGYNTESITEDFDLVVRLHRHLSDSNRPYRVRFVPEPVVWTEVPETFAELGRQRRRWYRGLIDTLLSNRGMMGKRRYGGSGVFGMPVLFFAEVLGPLVEGAGYVIVPFAFLIGAADLNFVIFYFALTIGFGVFLSWFGVFSEVWSFRRYDQPKQIARLLGDGVIENFGYRQWKTLIAWWGLLEYLRGNTSWGKMERIGFDHGTQN